MRTFIDFDEAPIVAIPTVGGIPFEGMLIEGPQGWGEFSPPVDADPLTLARWLTTAMEPSTVGWPDPVRGRIPVSVTVPAVTPDEAVRLVLESGCHTADVTVATASLDDDVARVDAVRDALGPGGTVRCDAHGRWDAASAITAIARLGELEYIATPCASAEDAAEVRRRVSVRIAAHATTVAPLTDIADVAILHVGGLGGVRRAMRIGDESKLPCVVASEPQTSVGLAAAVALAGALPELPFANALGGRTPSGGDVVSPARTLRPADGALPVAPMPPAPDPALVAHFAMTDRERVAWWRQRLTIAQQHGKSPSS